MCSPSAFPYTHYLFSFPSTGGCFHCKSLAWSIIMPQVSRPGFQLYQHRAWFTCHIFKAFLFQQYICILVAPLPPQGKDLIFWVSKYTVLQDFSVPFQPDSALYVPAYVIPLRVNILYVCYNAMHDYIAQGCEHQGAHLHSRLSTRTCRLVHYWICLEVVPIIHWALDFVSGCTCDKVGACSRLFILHVICFI